MRLDGAMKWYGAAALASVLVLVAGWFLLVSPTRASADDVAAQAETQQAANTAMQNKIDALKAQYKDLPNLQQQLSSIQVKLPQSPQVPALIRTLSTTSTKAGVTLLAFTPSNPTPLGTGAGTASATGAPDLAAAGQVNVIPVTMQVRGDFANVKLFLSSLESLPRAVLVTGINISRAGDAASASTSTAVQGSLTVTVTAKVFSANPGIAAPTTTTTSTAAAPATAS